MKHLGVIIYVAIAALLLSSCAEFVTYNQLTPIQKGMWLKDVRDELPLSPKGSARFTVRGIEYTIDYYPLQTSQKKEEYTSSQYSYGQGGDGYGLYRRDVTHKRTTDDINTIVFLYREGQLRYWGMLGEFAKTEDEEIAAMTPEIFRAYEGAYDE